MSYILDALRRADAERQRGGVPGLHDQTGPLTGGEGAGAPPAPAVAGRLALGGAVAALVALALAGAWWLGRGSAGQAPAGQVRLPARAGPRAAPPSAGQATRPMAAR